MAAMPFVIMGLGLLAALLIPKLLHYFSIR